MTSNARLLFLAPTILLATPAHAQDWPHWRGPYYNGSAKASNLPVEFTRKKHVAWETTLPGPGASTPIVVGDRIFLTAADTGRDRLVAMCLNRKDGKVLWMKDAGSGYGGESGSRTGGRRASYASPSATTDGETVVFFFGNGDLVGYDLDGKRLWRRNVQQDYGKFAFNWTFAASPTIWEGKVFLPVLQRDQPIGRSRGRRDGDEGRPAAPAKIESFILAADPKTGKTLYKHVRPSPARMESLESYTTAIPWDAQGRKELLLVGGDVLTGHDPENGKELWRWGTWNEGHRQRAWRLVPTVVVGDKVALVCAPKGAPVYAVHLGANGKVDQEAGLAWQSERRSPLSSDVPTPAFDGHHFYVVNDNRGSISKVNPKTGAVLWTTSLSRDFRWRASPTVADGKVFLMNHNGEVVIIDAAGGKALHHAFMGDEDDDQVRSSVVVAHQNLFIRTNASLFCISQ
ncbi:MAG: PQQ-binding-like beta-propeller repeat protein [Planctomycetota bacterium]|nr:PQQ-binding-like beta-propeller repeat protein [Planctomycetota bacterium]